MKQMHLDLTSSSEMSQGCYNDAFILTDTARLILSVLLYDWEYWLKTKNNTIQFAVQVAGQQFLHQHPAEGQLM